MGTLTAHHYCRNTVAPLPGRPAIKAMLAQIEQAMRELGYRPLELKVEAWRVPPAAQSNTNFLAKISIDCEPGEMLKPLVTWYEWQHPRWQWSHSPLPMALPLQEILPA